MCARLEEYLQTNIVYAGGRHNAVVKGENLAHNCTVNIHRKLAMYLELFVNVNQEVETIPPVVAYNKFQFPAV